MMHTARYERLFPGEGGIDLGALARAMPKNIVVSLEVPTAELAKTVDAKTRAQRALDAARKLIAGSRLNFYSITACSAGADWARSVALVEPIMIASGIEHRMNSITSW
jgi:hypothetical protein